MSHLVPVIDYSGSPDPIAAIHAARLERQRRIAAAAYTPSPPKAPPVVAEPSVDPIAFYRLVFDSTAPIDVTQALAASRLARRPAAKIAMDLVTRRTGVPRHELMSRRRARNVSVPRQIVYWLLKECTSLSYPGIGRQTGWRDHTTILHGVVAVQRRMTEDSTFRSMVCALRDELREALA